MINIEKNKKMAIDIAAFIIPAVIAYLSNKYFESSAMRLAYAAIIGLVFCIPVCNITQGANAEFRKNAPVYDKVRILLYIIAFPILYILLYDSIIDSTRFERALASLLGSAIATQVIWFIIKYIIILFSRKD